MWQASVVCLRLAHMPVVGSISQGKNPGLHFLDHVPVLQVCQWRGVLRRSRRWVDEKKLLLLASTAERCMGREPTRGTGRFAAVGS